MAILYNSDEYLVVSICYENLENKNCPINKLDLFVWSNSPVESSILNVNKSELLSVLDGFCINNENDLIFSTPDLTECQINETLVSNQTDSSILVAEIKIDATLLSTIQNKIMTTEENGLNLSNSTPTNIPEEILNSTKISLEDSTISIQESSKNSEHRFSALDFDESSGDAEELSVDLNIINHLATSTPKIVNNLDSEVKFKKDNFITQNQLTSTTKEAFESSTIEITLQEETSILSTVDTEATSTQETSTEEITSIEVTPEITSESSTTGAVSTETTELNSLSLESEPTTTINGQETEKYEELTTTTNIPSTTFVSIISEIEEIDPNTETVYNEEMISENATTVETTKENIPETSVLSTEETSTVILDKTTEVHTEETSTTTTSTSTASVNEEISTTEKEVEPISELENDYQEEEQKEKVEITTEANSESSNEDLDDEDEKQNDKSEEKDKKLKKRG